MNNQFVEPDVIWRSDRSYQDKGEEVRLERGEYQGRSTYKLRLMWKTPDGQWRWSQARETSSGKTWADFGLKQKELQALGELLIAEAKSRQPALDLAAPMVGGRGPMARDQRGGTGERFADGTNADDSIPF